MEIWELLYLLGYGICQEGAPRPDTAFGFRRRPRDSSGIRRFRVYHHGLDSVTAFVLAGGKSSRMGQDKAFLEIGGRILLAHALELVEAVAGTVRIAGSAENFARFGPVVEDLYPGQGPLAGIHAALTASVTDLNLIIAVDMPFLQPAFLNYLLQQARATTAVVVAPRTAGGWQPLCAVYRLEFAAVAERSLRIGRNKIDSLFAQVPTRAIEPEELEQNGFEEDMFRNLNTQQDWQAAQQKLSAQ